MLAAYTLVNVAGVQTWKYYLPGLEDSSTLDQVVPLTAYWLNIDAKSTFVDPVVAPSPTPPPAPTPPQPGSSPPPTIVGPATGIEGGTGWQAVQIGQAVWYGQELAGNRTYCGDVFDPSLLTAASNTLPCGTIARVTNTKTGRSVVVKINDRGGFDLPLVIDLSKAAYDAISPPSSGPIPVIIETR